MVVRAQLSGCIHMYKRYLNKLSRTRLDDVLIDEGVLDRSHIEDAQAECEMTGHPLSYVLFERSEMDEWELAKIVARNYSLPFVDVVQYSTPREAEVLLDLEFCRTHLVVPFDVFGQLPAVAACEMPSHSVIEEIERRTGFTPFIYVTLRSRLLEVLAARHEAGIAPKTAADAPRPPVATKVGAVEGEASKLELEPASMRLGFNMHMRSSRASAESLPKPRGPTGSPLPPAIPRRPAAPPPPRPKPEVPFVVADAVDEDAAVEVTSPAEADAAPAGKSAAWQSIFDLGDEAVS